MFYEQKAQKMLRFGDVLQGYLSSTPVIKTPILKQPIHDCHIDVNLPKYTVVMDPCCRTRYKMISLTPLIKVWGTLFDNPYLAKDLTKVNRAMIPQQSVPPEVWKGFSQEEKLKRLKEGLGYAFESFFIYASDPHFSEYVVNRKKGSVKTKHYMIDFRNTFKLCCDKMISPSDAPLESKVLQLSYKTRYELRDKISAYYGKVPEEDKILED